LHYRVSRFVTEAVEQNNHPLCRVDSLQAQPSFDGFIPRELKMYRPIFRALFLLSLFTLGVMVTPACSSTITTYSSLASWQAATSGVQIDNFESLGTPGAITPTGAILQNGVEFLGLSGQTGIADTNAYSWLNFGTGFAGFNANTAGTVHITLPTAVTAFSINLFTNPAAVTYTVTTLSTPFTVPTFTTSTGPAFFGVTSDTAFSTVDLQVPTGTTYALFDNFQWGTAQAGQDLGDVPEAGTFLLIGTGLMGFAIFRRKALKPRA
jgi:PEP-CTERM motif